MSDIKTENDTKTEEMGFNDAELQDIMNEIESLEKEFVETAPISSEPEQSAEALKISPDLVEKTDLQKQIEEEMNAVLEGNSVDNNLGNIDLSTTTDSAVSDDNFDYSENAIDSDLLEADEILGSVENIETEFHHETSESTLDDNVIDINSHVTSSVSHKEKELGTSPVSLACEGNMSLSMKFKIGEGEVRLNVNGDKGVTLSFSGVEVQMTEENGCIVEMNNGVKFQIPLAEVKSKKNVA